MVNKEHLRVLISGETKGLKTSLSEAQSELNKFSGKLKTVGKNITMSLSAPIIAFGGYAVKMRADLVEALNKVDVAFGDSAKEVREFAKTTISQFGISEGAALDMAAMFGDMATSMGISRQEASKLSTSLVGLAGDLASFKNINIEQATTALAGVFTGETESLKRLGIVMTIANLEQFAMNQGINKQIKDMTQAEKVMLRYKYMVSVTGNAQGDFARTLDSTSNQMKVMQQGFKQVAADVGRILEPAFNKLLHRVNGLIESFLGLDDSTKRIIIGIAGIVALSGPLLYLAGTVLPAMVKGFRLLNLAITANPIIAATTAIVGLTLAFNQLISNITPNVSILDTIWNGIKNFGNAAGFATDQVKSQVDAMKKLEKTGGKTLEQQAEDIVGKMKLGQVTNDVASALGNLDIQQRKVTSSVLSHYDAKSKLIKRIKETTELIGGSLTPNLKGLIKIQSDANTADLESIAILKQKGYENKKLFDNIKEQGGKLQEVFNVLDNNLELIAGTVGGVLVDSFEALMTGGDFMKTIIDGLKKLVIKLLAAAAAALVLSAILSSIGLAKPPNFGALFSAMAGFSSFPALEFANGGVISGPTLGLMGEYTGARSNPEVVAPLDKLKTMIGNSGGGNVQVSGEFKLRGQDLVVALQRANKERNRIL